VTSASTSTRSRQTNQDHDRKSEAKPAAKGWNENCQQRKAEQPEKTELKLVGVYGRRWEVKGRMEGRLGRGGCYLYGDCLGIGSIQGDGRR
jgi:hypothetical protein